jgi:YggT family protein
MLLAQLINLYVYAIFGRIILSYFPLAPGGAMASVFGFLYTITEPVLGPLRRVIPPIGMFDLSPMVAIFGLFFIANLLSG